MFMSLRGLMDRKRKHISRGAGDRYKYKYGWGYVFQWKNSNCVNSLKTGSSNQSHDQIYIYICLKSRKSSCKCNFWCLGRTLGHVGTKAPQKPPKDNFLDPSFGCIFVTDGGTVNICVFTCCLNPFPSIFLRSQACF